MTLDRLNFNVMLNVSAQTFTACKCEFNPNNANTRLKKHVNNCIGITAQRQHIYQTLYGSKTCCAITLTAAYPSGVHLAAATVTIENITSSDQMPTFKFLHFS
eukprot:SAG31_NODE_11970_length_981_cov_0.848073_2_plen_102_part_01